MFTEYFHLFTYILLYYIYNNIICYIIYWIFLFIIIFNDAHNKIIRVKSILVEMPPTKFSKIENNWNREAIEFTFTHTNIQIRNTFAKYLPSCFANDTNHQAESEWPIAADTLRFIAKALIPRYFRTLLIFSSRRWASNALKYFAKWNWNQ